MPWHNKVVWSEGMFLRPQHFQQQDRYHEHQVGLSLLAQRPYAWGLVTLEIDRGLLEAGKFLVPSCRAVMPDGSLFNVPEDQDPPLAIEVPAETREQVVVLATPVETEALAAAEVVSAAGHLSRNRTCEIAVHDVADGSLGAKADI